MIKVILNYTEILRIIKKAGWNIIDSIFSKSKDEINALKNMDIKDISYLKVRKGPLTFDVPPSFFARMQFELLSPNTMIGHFEELYNMGPQKEYDYSLTNFIDEQKIWI